MNRIDGREVRRALSLEADVVIVGSGPAGASVAREASLAGASVIVVEEGHFHAPSDFAIGAFDAMANTYRDMGASIVLGSAPMPYVQGRMVGGSSPINGAICWRTPRDVYDEWVASDAAIGDAIPWEALERATDLIEARLNVKPTDPAIAGAKNQLLARGAQALGLAHRPIRRNVDGCEGLGRCMQGCPKGRKTSVDATLLADAEVSGARVLSAVTVTHIETERGRATGVVGLSEAGATVRVRARRAVVVAASAVQSPVLLMRSGITHGPVGQNFQCHPGVSMAGRFPEPVRMWEGATQGHEVIGLRHEGLKFEALGFGLGVMAGRLTGVGHTLAREIDDIAHVLDWGAAVRAEARGRVRVFRKKPLVFFSPTRRDVAKFRRGLRVMGEMMLAAGADHVSPGVRGFMPKTSRVSELVALEDDGPTRASAYTAAITHMFGTCRLGSDAAKSVVRTDFRHHTTAALYVADSSVFPTSLGVNPQIPIMAMATLCARKVLGPDAHARTHLTTITETT